MNNNEMYASEWGMMMMDSTEDDSGSEDLSRYSSAQEPSNDFVLGSWQVDQGANSGRYEEDDDDLMIFDSMVDETPLTPPAGRLLLEEALEDTLSAAMAGRDDDEESFFTTESSNVEPTSLTSYLPAEQRYQATLDKLAESMKRSQETRKSLRIQTTETMEYGRWGTICGTLSSIEKSTKELQHYLNNAKPTSAAQVL